MVQTMCCGMMQTRSAILHNSSADTCNSPFPIRVQDEDNCTVGQVDDGATLIGFPDDDVCVVATE